MTKHPTGQRRNLRPRKKDLGVTRELAAASRGPGLSSWLPLRLGWSRQLWLKLLQDPPPLPKPWGRARIDPQPEGDSVEGQGVTVAMKRGWGRKS